MSQVTVIDATPRNRSEAAEKLGAAKAADPAHADRYRIRLSTGGYLVVRIDP